MRECDKCGQEDLLNSCNHCGSSFCRGHILPENHNCPALRQVDIGDGDSLTIGDVQNDSGDETQSTGRSPGSSEREFESSPDVAPDGSVVDDDRDDQDDNGDDDDGLLHRAIAGGAASREFRGTCPHCDQYIRRRRGQRITRCRECGWRPGLPVLRYLTHYPAWGHYKRRSISFLWTSLKLVPVLIVLAGIIGATVGTGVPWIDNRAGEMRDDIESAVGDAPDDAEAGFENITGTQPISNGSIEREIYNRTNTARAEQLTGEASLERDEYLDTLARQHSRRMLKTGAVDHDGFDNRSNHAQKRCGISDGVSENVHSTETYVDMKIYGTDETVFTDDAEAVGQVLVRGWLNSDGHRENLLGRAYTKIGVGVATSEDGEVYATQIFC